MEANAANSPSPPVMSDLKLNLEGTTASHGVSNTTSPTGEVNFNQEKADSTDAIIDAMQVGKAVPYRMKIYTEFNLATWLKLVKFTELNISEF